VPYGIHAVLRTKRAGLSDYLDRLAFYRIQNYGKPEIFRLNFSFFCKNHVLHSFLSFFSEKRFLLHDFFKKSRIFNGKLSKIY